MYTHKDFGLPGGSMAKNLPANAGDAGSISGSENPLKKEMATHSSILAWQKSMDREPWRATFMESQRNTT